MSWHDYLAERHNMSNAVANTLGVLQVSPRHYVPADGK